MARQESNRQSGSQARPLPKRRLPLVPPKKEPLLPARPPSPTEAQNPYVRQIVESIRRVCAISHLPAFTLIDDWTGMLEAALRLYAACAVQHNFRKVDFSSVTLEKVIIVVQEIPA